MHTMGKDGIWSEQSVLIVDGSVGRCRREECCSLRDYYGELSRESDKAHWDIVKKTHIS